MTSSGTSLGPLWRAPQWHLLRHSKSILSMLLEGSSVASLVSSDLLVSSADPLVRFGGRAERRRGRQA